MFFGANYFDYVSRRPLTPLDVTASDPSPTFHQGYSFMGHESNNATDGGVRSAEDSPFMTGTHDELTYIVCVEVDSIDAFSGLMVVPYNLTTWNAPFHSISLVRNDTTATQADLRADNNDVVGSSTSGFISTGARHTYACTLRGESGGNGAFEFYKDGVSYNSGTNGLLTTGKFVFQTSQMHIFSRNNAATGEGTNGRFYWGAMFMREKGARDIQTLTENPLQILKRPDAWLETVASSGTTITLVMNHRRHM